LTDTTLVKLLAKPRTTLNNYKEISLYVPLGVSCTWKCQNCCNVHYKNNTEYIEMTYKSLIELYKRNKLVKALVISGLEPFDSFDSMYYLIYLFREKIKTDKIVIYSGYEYEEIEKKLNKLKILNDNNMIVKLGRYIPNKEKIFDKNLGIYLASNNQYSIKI
jgi:pyruvate-formate lyase-activating enzyme